MRAALIKLIIPDWKAQQTRHIFQRIPRIWRQPPPQICHIPQLNSQLWLSKNLAFLLQSYKRKDSFFSGFCLERVQVGWESCKIQELGQLSPSWLHWFSSVLFLYLFHSWFCCVLPFYRRTFHFILEIAICGGEGPAETLQTRPGQEPGKVICYVFITCSSLSCLP